MSRIIVKNLPNSGVDANEIKKHFADIDDITDIKLNYNDSGAFRRFAFVGFKSQDGADRAIEKLNNSFIKNGRIILEKGKAYRDVRLADEKNPQHYAELLEENNIKQRKLKKDVFEDVKDQAEFKEFISLQRNIGEKSKQVWADDMNMTCDFVEKEPQLTANNKSEAQNDKPKKKHKRSRPKKKSTKTQPKELFVNTAKVSGIPQDVRRKDVKDFFKPLELISVRLNKKDNICFVSFKNDRDLKFALRKNLQFWGTSRIKVLHHNVERSRVFKERLREKVKQRDESREKYKNSLAETEAIEESGRLFVRNLNYTCTQDDLQEVFSKYGEITEIHFPIDKTTSLPKGFAYVEFMFPQNAQRALQELNGTIFQGRNFHLIPSKPKPEPRFPSNIYPNPNNNQISRQNSGDDAIKQEAQNQDPQIRTSFKEPQASLFKKQKLIDQKKTAPLARSNWNILFLGQNALADVVSDMKGVEKSRMLTHQTTKEPIAVRMALGDAAVVEETRKFLVSNGVELDSFDNSMTRRSNSVIIAKNLPASTTRDELEGLFGRFGRVSRVIIPPNGLTALVEMDESVEAKTAFKKLAYSKFKDSVLYLEWAPINVFREKSLEEQEENDYKQLKALQTGSKILVKNIPFEANVNELRKIFAAYGEVNFVRIPKKIDGQHRGFGFVEYLTNEDALRAFKSLCHSTHLYGRKIVLEWAKTSAEDSKPVNQQHLQEVSAGGDNTRK